MRAPIALPRPIIRRAIPEDAEALALVGAATFLESYALTLGGTDIVRHCAVHHAPKVYADWLARPECAVWLAEAGDGKTVVGFSVLTPPDLPGATEGDLELRRIYLLSRFQGGGVGRELIDLAAKESRQRGASRLVLGVYGENQTALSFYRHCGFAEIGTREFQVGDRLCSDFVLALEL